MLLTFQTIQMEFARKNLDNVKTQVEGQVASLGQTATHMWDTMNKLGLREQAKERLAAVQERLGHIWTEVNKTEEQVSKEAESEKTQSDASEVSVCHGSYTVLMACFGVLWVLF